MHGLGLDTLAGISTVLVLTVGAGKPRTTAAGFMSFQHPWLLQFQYLSAPLERHGPWVRS
jgi:hypothetical protein